MYPEWKRIGTGWGMIPPDHLIISSGLRAIYGYDTARQKESAAMQSARIPDELKSKAELLLDANLDYNVIAESLGISAFQVFELIERNDKTKEKYYNGKDD